MTTSIGLDDDEELRSRSISLQGAVPTPFTPFLQAAAPQGLSSLSSIEKASNPSEKTKRSSPILAPPNQNAVWSVIDSYQKDEKLAIQGVDLFKLDTDQMMQNLQRLAREKEEASQKEAEATAGRSTWSGLATVAQCITSVGLGVAAYSMGGVPGLFLAFSAALGLTNVAMSNEQTNFIKYTIQQYTTSAELQKKIENDIRMGFTIAQLGFGLAGGFGAWQAGSLAATNGALLTEKARTVLNGAGTVVSVGTRLGGSYYDKRLTYVQAEMKDKDTQTTLLHQDLHESSEKIRREQQYNEEKVRSIEEAIQTSEISAD